MSVLLIISNSNWQRRNDRIAPNGDLRLVSSDLPCAGWRGDSNWQLVGSSWSAESRIDYTLRGEATPTFSVTGRTLSGDQVELAVPADRWQWNLDDDVYRAESADRANDQLRARAVARSAPTWALCASSRI
ncbi:MAG: hypothetical protein HZY76_00640 [Anaerolineae bacterium]|nr:MAG: hypothetical protein HZY76_00640 [Anaerolineae bacterium]